MDYAKAHIVTLWCAVIAKATRGVTKLLPKQMTPLQFRLLAQLTLPESERVLPMRAARLLVGIYRVLTTNIYFFLYISK